MLRAAACPAGYKGMQRKSDGNSTTWLPPVLHGDSTGNQVTGRPPDGRLSC